MVCVSCGLWGDSSSGAKCCLSLMGKLKLNFANHVSSLWVLSAPVDSFSQKRASPQSFNRGNHFLFPFIFTKCHTFWSWKGRCILSHLRLISGVFPTLMNRVKYIISSIMRLAEVRVRVPFFFESRCMFLINIWNYFYPPLKFRVSLQWY